MYISVNDAQVGEGGVGTWPCLDMYKTWTSPPYFEKKKIEIENSLKENNLFLSKFLAALMSAWSLGLFPE